MIKHELGRTGSKNFYFLFIDHVHLIGKLQLGVFSEPEYACTKWSFLFNLDNIAVCVFGIVKVQEIELQAAYTVISNSDNSVQANQAGTSAAQNPVPSQVSKPGRQKNRT